MNRFVIQKERDQQLVLYWYLAQGQPVAGETLDPLLDAYLPG